MARGGSGRERRRARGSPGGSGFPAHAAQRDGLSSAGASASLGLARRFHDHGRSALFNGPDRDRVDRRRSTPDAHPEALLQHGGFPRSRGPGPARPRGARLEGGSLSPPSPGGQKRGRAKKPTPQDDASGDAAGVVVESLEFSVERRSVGIPHAESIRTRTLNSRLLTPNSALNFPSTAPPRPEPGPAR